jgi:hypothetical protein
MKNIVLFALFQLFLIPAFAQEIRMNMNQTDAQHRKQGPWSEEVPEIRGEDGYTWEGNYVNDVKEGVWKKYAQAGAIIAEETYKHGVLSGHCRYFYPNGQVSAEGNFIAIDLDGQSENYRVIDPVTGEEHFEEVPRNPKSLRDGVWKVYDEDGQVTKEYYKRGEMVPASALIDSTDTKRPALPPPPPPAPAKKKGH